MSLEFNTFSRGLDSPMIFFILYYMMDVCSSLPNNQTYYKLIKEEKTHFQGQVSFILFELYFSIFGFVSLDLKEKSRTELFQNISNIWQNWIFSSGDFNAWGKLKIAGKYNFFLKKIFFFNILKKKLVSANIGPIPFWEERRRHVKAVTTGAKKMSRIKPANKNTFL